jgi:hypothetical protein
MKRETSALFAPHLLASWEDLAPRRVDGAGFFIPDLVDHTFDSAWRSYVHGTLPAEEPARAWWEASFFNPRWVKAIRESFLNASPVLHIGLEGIFPQDRAWQLWQALQEATFQRHHFPSYHIDIAPHDKLPPNGILAQIVAWLGSPEAAKAHRWLVGWPMMLPQSPRIQVQISRLREGDAFALHEDTHAEGIAVVYNLSAHWKPEYGGALCFPHPQDPHTDALFIPPVFNSVFVFRPQGAPHRVSPVLAHPAALSRYTITIFYLTEPE